jgi:hypothetical protein
VRAEESAYIVASAVAETISYQGVLLSAGGAPLTGTYSMRFALYDAAAAGSLIHETGLMNVSVSSGLFHVGLAVPQSAFDGRALWLQITVQGEILSPRQEIRPAPYAMSLRPGARVVNAATGTAVRIESQDVALYGTGHNYGVRGVSTSPTQGRGYGGYFESSTGIGVHGESTAQITLQNAYAPGVSGYSQNGVGIFGQAATAFGLYGTSAGNGVGGVGRAYGVYGVSSSPTQGSGYGGYFASSTGIGVHGRSTAQLTLQNQFAPGVSGYSQRGAAIYGQSGEAGSVAGYFAGNVIVTGNLHVSGNISGMSATETSWTIARNGDDEPLTMGDLVVAAGVTAPLSGAVPVPLVRRADLAASTAVIGVVGAAHDPDEADQARLQADFIAPGDPLRLVTVGEIALLKVDAGYGAIHPGDLLVSSPTPGHAMRSEDPGVGTVIGKALDALPDGTGTIAVIITLQ